MKSNLAIFEDYKIRRLYDETTDTWYFSVVDIIRVLIQQPDFQAARNYWKVLKNRLTKEGSESVTKCNRLKMVAADGKNYLTDVADVETLLRLIQSVPSPKAEPIKLWLAKVGYERMQEMIDPERSVDRARENWQKHGRSPKWIQQRMMGQETRNKLTDYWKDHDITKELNIGSRVYPPRLNRGLALSHGFFLFYLVFRLYYLLLGRASRFNY
jgi:DNA-damage-inducible protein D